MVMMRDMPTAESSELIIDLVESYAVLKQKTEFKTWEEKSAGSLLNNHVRNLVLVMVNRGIITEDQAERLDY